MNPEPVSRRLRSIRNQIKEIKIMVEARQGKVLEGTIYETLLAKIEDALAIQDKCSRRIRYKHKKLHCLNDKIIKKMKTYE
jgi:hypothetical protein